MRLKNFCSFLLFEGRRDEKEREESLMCKQNEVIKSVFSSMKTVNMYEHNVAVPLFFLFFFSSLFLFRYFSCLFMISREEHRRRKRQKIPGFCNVSFSIFFLLEFFVSSFVPYRLIVSSNFLASKNNHFIGKCFCLYADVINRVKMFFCFFFSLLQGCIGISLFFFLKYIQENNSPDFVAFLLVSWPVRYFLFCLFSQPVSIIGAVWKC